MSERKRVLGIYGAASSHWVGDGFPVRTVFPSPRSAGIAPFPDAGLCRSCAL